MSPLYIDNLGLMQSLLNKQTYFALFCIHCKQTCILCRFVPSK